MSLGLAKVSIRRLRRITRDPVTSLVLQIYRCINLVNPNSPIPITMLISVQMTRMAEEHDSILHVHAKVDSFDEWGEPQGVEPTVSDNLPDSRVSLCAP